MAELGLDDVLEMFGYPQERKDLEEELKDAPAPTPVGPPAPIGVGTRAGSFWLQDYAPGAVTTLHDFAEQMAVAGAAYGPQYRQVAVRFTTDSGDVIWRNVALRAEALSVGALERRLEKLTRGEPLGGSDAVTSEFSLDLSAFRVGYVRPVGGGAFKGVSKGEGRSHPHFRLRDFSVKLAGAEKTNDCLLAILRAVGKENKLAVPRARNNTLRMELGIPAGPIDATDANMQALGAKFGLRVLVITGMAALPDLEREFDDDAARPKEKNRCLSRPEEQVIAEGGPVGAPECRVFLADGHYEYIDHVLEPLRVCVVTGDLLEEGKELSKAQMRHRVVAQGRNWYGADGGLAKKTALRKTYENELVVVYDYETTYDSTGALAPYALGFYAFDPNAPPNAFNFGGEAASVSISCRRPGGDQYSVSTPLLDMLARAPDSTRYTLVSFNGVRFDHFLLAAAAHNRGHSLDVFATQAGLRTVRIGRHFTLDLAKLVPGKSLASACDDFKTAPTKVAGFEHTVPQRAHENGTFEQWFAANCAAITTYLCADVLSTASLFVRLRAALGEVAPDVRIYGHGCSQTIGQVAWKLMSEACPLPAPVEAHATDKKIRGAVTGGRVQVYRALDAPKHPVAHVMPRAQMYDVVSLYPTAMAAAPKVAALFGEEERWGWYPSGKNNGEPLKVGDYQPGMVGIYDVTVHAQPWPNVLPRRTEGEPLNWEFRGEFDTQATHIDIALIVGAGGRVTVKSGLVWPVCRPGLFRPYVDGLIAKKNEQDALDARKDPAYNPSLREVYKLLLNSASGKCCQENYDDVTALATGSHNQQAAERKMDPTKPVEWLRLGGETCILIGKKPEAKIYKKRTAKPSILAVLIYAYSRAYVWRTLCQFGILYSDTDSGLFSLEDGERLRRAFPALDPTGRMKELGDLEEELGPHARAEAYLVSPKDYAVFLFSDEKADDFQYKEKPDPKDKTHKMEGRPQRTLLVSKSKIRMKGVNQRSDRAIAPEHLRFVKRLKAQPMAAYTEEYHRAEQDRSKPLRELPIALEFFRQRAQGAKVHVLTSQIVRTFKDEARPFSLAQQFMVKEL